jgi:hypothetical protein
MSEYTRRTFQQLTAPGYFDYSAQQTEFDVKINTWLNNTTEIIQENTNLMDSIFRLWASRSYSLTTVTMTPWIRYLLFQNGIGWYNQNLAIAVKLLIYVTRSYPSSAILCFQQYFAFLFDIGWITQVGQILFSPATPAKFSETFLIYSTSGSPPSTPAPSTYTPLLWTAPTDWTIAASSATYYARGYIDSGNIVWMTPQDVNTVFLMTDYELLADLPGSASTGQLAGVNDDGSGDVGSIYYFDGSVWRKTTGANANQGLVVGQAPPVPGSSVWTPESDTYSSGVQPPVDGPSEGYGYYGIYGQLELKAKRIDIIINLTESGVANLGLIVFLFRKIKPTLNSLYVGYTTPDNSEIIEIEILDQGAVPV